MAHRKWSPFTLQVGWRVEAELRAAAERHEAHEAELRQQLEAARQQLARQEAEAAGGRGRVHSSPHAVGTKVAFTSARCAAVAMWYP